MGYQDRAYSVAREGDPASAETYEIWTPRMAARRYASEHLDEGEAAALIVESRCTFSERAWRAVVRRRPATDDPATYEPVQSMEELQPPA